MSETPSFPANNWREELTAIADWIWNTQAAQRPLVGDKPTPYDTFRALKRLKEVLEFIVVEGAVMVETQPDNAVTYDLVVHNIEKIFRDVQK